MRLQSLNCTAKGVRAASWRTFGLADLGSGGLDLGASRWSRSPRSAAIRSRGRARRRFPGLGAALSLGCAAHSFAFY